MKPTTAQVWATQSLEALAIGAAVTAAINVYTAFSAGNLTLSQAGVIAITAFGAILSKGIAGILSNPQTVQAGQDSINQLRDATIALLNSHQSLVDAITTQVVQTPQPASKAPEPIVLSGPRIDMTGPAPTVFNPAVVPGTAIQPHDLTVTNSQPTFVQASMPNLASTATATPTWIPPSPDIRFGDSGIIPAVPKQ